MNFDELTKQLKEQPAQVYLIQGEQYYLLDAARNLFKELIPIDERQMNYASYDMDEVELGVALNDAMSVPFFGERRVVVIEKPGFLTGEVKKQRLNHDVEGLQLYLEHPEPTTTLVFIAPYAKLDSRKKVVKELKKTDQILEFAEMTENQVRQFVERDIRQHGYQIEGAAMNAFVQRTNADLSEMMGELAKLYLYCYDEKVITTAAVNDLVTKSLTENVFDLVNAVLAKQTRVALTIYHDLMISGEEPLKMNALLVSQFRLLIQVKGLITKVRSEKELASQLKVHPYRIKLANQSAKRFAFDDLSLAYLGLIDIEKQMKSTQRSAELLFELFMVDFVNN